MRCLGIMQSMNMQRMGKMRLAEWKVFWFCVCKESTAEATSVFSRDGNCFPRFATILYNDGLHKDDRSLTQGIAVLMTSASIAGCMFYESNRIRPILLGIIVINLKYCGIKWYKFVEQNTDNIAQANCCLILIFIIHCPKSIRAYFEDVTNPTMKSLSRHNDYTTLNRNSHPRSDSILVKGLLQVTLPFNDVYGHFPVGPFLTRPLQHRAFRGS